MKEWTGGSHIVMNNTPRVPGDRTLMDIRYNYRYQKVLGFIDTEGYGSNEPGVPYLSRYPDNDYNVSIHPFLCPHVIGSYFSACNAIENHNSMWQYDIAIEKYWVNQNGYFRLETTVSLGLGILDGKISLYHGISEKSKEKTI